MMGDQAEVCVDVNIEVLLDLKGRFLGMVASRGLLIIMWNVLRRRLL